MDCASATNRSLISCTSPLTTTATAPTMPHYIHRESNIRTLPQRTYPVLTTASIPFIGQSIIWSCPHIRKQIQLCLTLRTDYELTMTAKWRNRQQTNILWQNPPFSKNINTNIGHRFLTLVNKHSLKDHKLRKIFNCNTIKISCSCMNNTKQIINNHNKHIVNTLMAPKTRYSRQKNKYPLHRNYLQSSVIYQATFKRNDNNTSETYIGLTENDFNTRYRNHFLPCKTEELYQTRQIYLDSWGQQRWPLYFMAYHFGQLLL